MVLYKVQQPPCYLLFSLLVPIFNPPTCSQRHHRVCLWHLLYSLYWQRRTGEQQNWVRKSLPRYIIPIYSGWVCRFNINLPKCFNLGNAKLSQWSYLYCLVCTMFQLFSPLCNSLHTRSIIPGSSHKEERKLIPYVIELSEEMGEMLPCLAKQNYQFENTFSTILILPLLTILLPSNYQYLTHHHIHQQIYNQKPFSLNISPMFRLRGRYWEPI